VDDPVLHRKMFRHTALRVGKLKPKKYNVGAPGYGVSPYGPFLTNESQGISNIALENQPGNRVVIKDGRRIIVDRFGNVVKTEYMPAKYKPGIGQRMSQSFFNFASRIPGVGTPEGMQKNVEAIKRFGQKAVDPQTYIRGAKTVGKGIAGIAKTTPMAIATEQALSKTGLNPVDRAIGMDDMGFATLLTSEGFRAAGKRLTQSPNALKRGIGYAMRIPGVAGSVRAVGQRALMSPAGIATMAVGGAGYGMKKLEDYLRANYPDYKAAAEQAQEESKTFMSPDDMFNSMTSEQIDALRSSVPNKGIEGPMSKSDLETKGEIAQIDKKTQEQATGGGGEIPTTGTPSPGDTGGPGGGVNDNKTLEQNIAAGAETKTDLDGKIKTKEIKLTGIDAKIPGPSIFDKLGNFARTTAGNMFMLKFAAGLLSGKGNFGEVVGNALNPAVDLLAAYRLKEDENAYKQMKLLMDSRGKVENERGMLRIVEDGTVRAVPAIRDKKTLVTYRIMPDGSRQAIDDENVSSGFRTYNASKATDVVDALSAYSNVSTARALAQFVANTDTALLGTSGFSKRLFDRIIGAGKGYFEAFKKADLTPPSFTDAQGNALTGDALKQAEQQWSQVTAGSKKIFENADATTRKRLEQLGLTETTLRYFLANAFKQKDRLTNVDLQLINELVQTMGASISGEQVQERMNALIKILDEKMNTYKENVREYGIDDYQFATRFYQTPGAKITFGLISDQGEKTDFSKMGGKDLDTFLKGKGFQ